MIKEVQNPIIPLDYPDPDVIRVADTYYMVTTTMHFMPGCEILRSYDLVNWEHATFVYDQLDSTPAQKLEEHANIYGRGMWAATIRYHKNKFYIIFVANDTRTTYLYTSANIEGPWQKSIIEGFYHDCSLFFDDDERAYLVYGNKDIWLTELNNELTGPKHDGIHKIIVTDHNNPNLGYEGAHFYKINGKYYVFLIHSLPDRWMRVQACYQSNSIDGQYVGGDVLQDTRDYCGQGVAQGGIVDTPEGEWYAILFQDHGAVGRLPVLLPIEWNEDYPVFGVAGKVPKVFKATSTRPIHSYTPLVSGDDFKTTYPQYYGLDPKWQFNHEPNESGFKVNTNEGYFEISTTKVVKNLTQAPNTLTQRMLLPSCSAEVQLDATDLMEGDFAGLCAFQGAYGFVGVTKANGQYYLVMHSRELDNMSLQAMDHDHAPGKEWGRVAIDSPIVTLKLKADFDQMKDVTQFYYQDNGLFKQIGIDHKVAFKLDHFTGCRFGLFCFATKELEGSARFSTFKYLK
ncbi:Beta-xylosidase [Amphibacillus marinus]|uniref:Beta-xylosidase n=1 Tax=Amphibacillus marinus TaxID=872970 RepID=A0A1H8GP98_9BACI|nr:glycoside hydrolase 43 family protein [Amphibacillus marinus]SEN45625.1 Beta-xylosidase [Amphibacillus marinus]